MKIPATALLYFAIVFGAGFAVGPVWVLFVESRVGSTIAVLIEAPVLVIAMVMGANLAIRWSGVARSSGALPLGRHHRIGAAAGR